MDGVTKNNAWLLEEQSSTSRSLYEQAHALRGMVGVPCLMITTLIQKESLIKAVRSMKTDMGLFLTQQ